MNREGLYIYNTLSFNFAILDAPLHYGVFSHVTPPPTSFYLKLRFIKKNG